MAIGMEIHKTASHLTTSSTNIRPIRNYLLKIRAPNKATQITVTKKNVKILINSNPKHRNDLCFFGKNKGGQIIAAAKDPHNKVARLGKTNDNPPL
jgi:hypothetical protein